MACRPKLTARKTLRNKACVYIRSNWYRLPASVRFVTPVIRYNAFSSSGFSRKRKADEGTYVLSASIHSLCLSSDSINRESRCSAGADMRLFSPFPFSFTNRGSSGIGSCHTGSLSVQSRNLHGRFAVWCAWLILSSFLPSGLWGRRKRCPPKATGRPIWFHVSFSWWKIYYLLPSANISIPFKSG